MFEKIIDKVFFKKVIFKIFIVLTFFLSLTLCILAYSDYTNPYSRSWKTYDNLLEFVDNNMKYQELYQISSVPMEIEYVNAFIRQAINKKIISIKPGSFNNVRYILLEPVYSCDNSRLQEFRKKFKENNGFEYNQYGTLSYEHISIDCEKAKTIPLAPENYYFIKYELKAYIVTFFVYIPLTLLVLWLILRFIIISPILWIYKKD